MNVRYTDNAHTVCIRPITLCVIQLIYITSLTFRSRFTKVFYCYERMLLHCTVSLGACFSTNAERSVIDLRVLTVSALLNFTNCGWQKTRTGRLRRRTAHLPTSSVHCSPPSRSDRYSDRPPAFQRLVQGATRTTAANQAECEKILLYSFLSSEINYPSLKAEHTQVSQTTHARFLLHCWGVLVR